MQEVDWKRGIDEFNLGRYWEAHHHWERGWKDLPDPIKLHIQALIQACAVFLHLQNGRLGPAQALCRLAGEKFIGIEMQGGIDSIYPRVEVPGLTSVLAELKLLLDSGETLREADWTRIRDLRARYVFEEGK